MFTIERTRPIEPERWQFPDREEAIARARAALVATGDVVTVCDSASGETLWTAVMGRDGNRHEWSASEPHQVSISQALPKAA